MVGSAIWKNLQDKGYTNLIGRTHQELDLLDGVAVRRFFDEEQPEYVFLAAAFVGGIMANSIYLRNIAVANELPAFIIVSRRKRHNFIGQFYQVFCFTGKNNCSIFIISII